MAVVVRRTWPAARGIALGSPGSLSRGYRCYLRLAVLFALLGASLIVGQPPAAAATPVGSNTSPQQIGCVYCDGAFRYLAPGQDGVVYVGNEASAGQSGFSGTLRNLSVTLSNVPPGAQYWYFSIRSNGQYAVAPDNIHTLTCNPSPGGSSCSTNPAISVLVAASDNIDLAIGYSSGLPSLPFDLGQFTVKWSVDLVAADSTPPTTTITLGPAAPNGQNGWYISNVHATVTAADDPSGSGVAETRCVLDPASAPATFDALPAACAYTGAGADVTSNGQHVLYAASKDQAGNPETPVSAAFNIDKTPPSLTVTGASTAVDGFMPTQSFTTFPATAGTSSVALSGTASDTVSGLASLTVNGTPGSVPAGPGSSPWSLSGLTLSSGPNTLSAKLTNAAGLTSTVTVSITLNMDLDGDGIANNIDGNSTVTPVVSQALTSSSRFSDKLLRGTTSGSIVSKSAGIGVAITDATPNPGQGVQVVVTGPAAGRARVRLDGKGGTYRLPPGTYVLTDPDLTSTVEVTAGGPAEYDLLVNGADTVIVVSGKATIKETTGTNGAVLSISVLSISGPTTLNGAPLPAGKTLPTYDVCYLAQVFLAARMGTPIPPGLKADLASTTSGNSLLGILLHDCGRSGGTAVLLIANVTVKQVDATHKQYTVTLTINGKTQTFTFPSDN